MRLAAKQLSIFLLCAVFLLCLYRAATQSFTIDESFTFLHYVNVRFSQAIAEYSANNHVLQSLLMRVFRRLLGRSELVMRLPTLIGCVLYLTAVYGITAASIRNGWLRLLALAVMTLNPLVLDLLVAARGYALALGFSWWALYLAWSDLLEPKPRRLWLAGVCAGFAVTANLIFVIPLGVLGLMLLPLYARRGRFWQLIDSYAGPATIICFVLLFIPLLKSSGQFYFGVATLRDTFGSLLGESLRQPPAGSVIFDNLDRMIPNLSGHLAAVGRTAGYRVHGRRSGLAVSCLDTRSELGYCLAGPYFRLHCIVCWLLDCREPNVRHRISDDSDSVVPPAAAWIRDGAISVCIEVAHRFRNACLGGGGPCCPICR